MEVEIRMQVKSRQIILGQGVHNVPKEVCSREEEIQGRKGRQDIEQVSIHKVVEMQIREIEDRG